MDRIFFCLGSGLAGLAVVLGAFGAHGLRRRVPPDLLAVFETGVRYHFYHALALLAVAWAASRWPSAAVTASGWLFACGIAVFSGTLYALAMSGARWLGAITPLGGLALVAGWVLLAWGVARAGS